MAWRSAHADILESKLRKRLLHTLWRHRTNSISTHSVGSDARSVSVHLSIDQLLYKLQLGTRRQMLHCQQSRCLGIREWKNLWKPRLPSWTDNKIQQRIRICIWLFIQLRHKYNMLSINSYQTKNSPLGCFRSELQHQWRNNGIWNINF